MRVVDEAAPVLVTGGSGYVASWIVRCLLEAGHMVRATVRDPDKPGLDHLHGLADVHPGRLTLHRADLLDPGSFSAAMDGCELVVHTASPFTIGRIKDAERQFVRPALLGTRNVLASVDATESVQRVVLTSSVTAIFGDNADMAGKDCFTEDDWNTTSTVDHQPYSYSKTIAEREAWAVHDAQERWELVTIHPSMVLGPTLTTASVSGSMAMMRHFVDGSMALGAPALTMGVVDVRDVARAHIAAGLQPEAHGRYIVTADTASLVDIGTILSKRFGRRWSFPRHELPTSLLTLVAPAAGMTRKFVERNVGLPLQFDATRARRELEVRFRPVEETVVAHFQQMLDDGLA